MFKTGDNKDFSHVVFVIATSGYLLGVIFLALIGKIGFLSKTGIFPIMLLVAISSRRFKSFYSDWVVFLALVILFDSLRGYIYYLIQVLELDVYMQYVINIERTLLGDTLLINTLQHAWFDVNQISFFDKFMVMIHSSHFLLFLLIGCVIWIWNRKMFVYFKYGMLLIMYLGLAGYFLIPTVPPWMAAAQYKMFPEIHRICTIVYNFTMPRMLEMFDTNPIAAMPSLHTAFPVFLSFLSVKIYRWKGIFVCLYTVLVLFSIVYTGEHYIADILAGILLAAAVYLLIFRTRIILAYEKFLAWISDQVKDRWIFKLLDGRLGRQTALTVLILLAAVLSAHIARRSYPTNPVPSREFIQRELVEKSDLANFYLGMDAFSRKAYKNARDNFLIAYGELEPGSDFQIQAGRYLGRVAFEIGEYDLVLTSLTALHWKAIARDEGRILAVSYLYLGRGAEAVAVFKRLENSFPDASCYTMYKVLVGLYFSELTLEDVSEDISVLRDRFNASQASRTANSLEQLIQGGLPDAEILREKIQKELGLWMIAEDPVTYNLFGEPEMFQDDTLARTSAVSLADSSQEYRLDRSRLAFPN